MNNYSQPGEVLTVAAPSGGVVAGTAYKIGDLVGVATVTAAQTVDFAFFVGPGVISYAKAGSQAWAQNVKVYWDNSAGNFTTTAGGNTLVGVAARVVAGGAGDTTGYVRLDGVAR